MQYELNEEQMRAIYIFAETFELGDLYDMIGDKMTDEEIYNFDCVLSSIFNAFQK